MSKSIFIGHFISHNEQRIFMQDNLLNFLNMMQIDALIQMQWYTCIKINDNPFIKMDVKLNGLKFNLKLHLAYVLRWNRGKNIYFFSHI